MAIAAEIAAQLETPPKPMELSYIWDAYWRIRRRKSDGFSGPNPLEWPDIKAFLHLSGIRLAPWEIELIEGLDDIYRKVMLEDLRARWNGTTPASDGAGVKAAMRSVAAKKPAPRKSAQKKAKGSKDG